MLFWKNASLNTQIAECTLQFMDNMVKTYLTVWRLTIPFVAKEIDILGRKRWNPWAAQWTFW